ncbi:MAG: hypothetical protein Q9227_002804 [Pyrenula ochraceoflavens]
MDRAADYDSYRGATGAVDAASAGSPPTSSSSASGPEISRDYFSKEIDILAPSTDEGRRLYNYIAENSYGCSPPSRLRKRIDWDDELTQCLVTGTVLVVQAIAAQTFAAWRRIRDDRRQLRRPVEAGAVAALIAAEEQVAPLEQQLVQPGDPPGQFGVIVNAAFWETYNAIILHQADGSVVRIPEDDYDQTDQGKCLIPKDNLLCSSPSCNGKDGVCASGSIWAGCECLDPDCPDDEFIGDCINCGGDLGLGNCKGPYSKGCACYVPVPKSPPQFSDAQLSSLQQAAMKAVGPGCTHDELRRRFRPRQFKSRDASNGTVQMDGSLWKQYAEITLSLPDTTSTDYIRRLVADWCSKQPLTGHEKSLNVSVGDLPIGSSPIPGLWQDMYGGWEYEFYWQGDSGNCTGSIDCNSVYYNAVESSKDCVPGDDQMATDGEMDLNCGTASYSIYPAKTTIAPDPTSTSTSSSSTTTTDPSPAPSCPAQPPFPSVPDENCDWWTATQCPTVCPDGKYNGDGACSNMGPDFGWYCTCDEDPCAHLACANPDQKPSGC